MKVLRTARLARGAASVLLAAGPASAGGPLDVEGEAAVSYTTGCGDGGDAWDMGPVFYGGRVAMFFPASGCRATYATTAARVTTSVTVLMSGVGGTLCGTVTVTANVQSGSAAVCAPNDTWVTVNLNQPAIAANAPYTVRWNTGAGTPSYVNLFLDYLSGAGA